MDIDVIAPDLREPTLRLRGVDPDAAFARAVASAILPFLPAYKVAGVQVRAVRDRGTGARLRVHTPEVRRSEAALLWIHGGGYVLGIAKIDDRICGETAKELGIVVVSADYGLAPRHPFPGPLDDVHAVWRWLLGHAGELGVDPARIAVGGQSAGAGLAATLVQRIHDEGSAPGAHDGVPQPVAQWLFCPMLDDRTAADGSLDAVGHFVWDGRANRAGWTAYLGQAPGAESLPDYAAAARRADLAGLPPAWLDCGTVELFHDEVVAYAERLRAAGVPVVLDEVPGAPHGFETWAADTPSAQAVLGRARAWLGTTLGTGASGS